ncbi:MAG: ComF family protein, partial [Gammaproteobacteria bacterium]
MRKGLAVNQKGCIKVYNKLVALFGNHCFLCANRSEGPETICPACLIDLPFNTTACPACARPNTASRLCAACLNRPGSPGRIGHSGVFINKSRALFQYHYPVNHIIQCMKFRQCIELANYLGGMMGEIFFNDDTARPDCIIPVPLHTRRLISRGYNQSV